ncbi:MAG: hypothetical protein SGBAC_008690 [Bacillariaceae sp.]
MFTKYLRTALTLMLLSCAAAQEKQDEANGNFVQDYYRGVGNYPKQGSKRHSFRQDWMSSHGRHDLKLSKLEGSHYRQSKKFHSMHPDEKTLDKDEELLRLHKIISALKAEKLSQSVEKVKSWRSSSSSSSSSDDSSSSSSSSFDDGSQEKVQQVADEQIVVNAELEGIARVENEAHM